MLIEVVLLTKADHKDNKIYILILLQLFIFFTFTSHMIRIRPVLDSKLRDSTVLQELNEAAVSLLLNSGFTQAQTAQVKYILWFENSIPKSVLQALPQKGWEWDIKQKSNGTQKAATLVGSKKIIPSEEQAVEGSFLEIRRLVEQAGGSAYFDERINQAIDISAFLSTFKAVPEQWNHIQNTKSITAFQRDLGYGIRAGKDVVNIQMLSRATEGNGKTVLAIPVLLEEF